MKASRINEKQFNRLIYLTIIAVYLVILAGGIVRSTGSGMGCPDWPKCFGSWIPPTSESELPPDYREQYAQVRVAKNKRLAGYLSVLGFESLSQTLQAETIAAPEARFNKSKTWIEYINRLLGVIVGFLITAMAFVSIKYRKNNPPLFYGSIAAFVFGGFPGMDWLGSSFHQPSSWINYFSYGTSGLFDRPAAVFVLVIIICSASSADFWQTNKKS